MYASLAVGRPVRRIGEVLKQLADGDKTVRIPYTKRSDEIGDTARVADVFKDSMVRMEQIEAEQKHVEERLQAERKAEMHRLADMFEATVAISSTPYPRHPRNLKPRRSRWRERRSRPRS